MSPARKHARTHAQVGVGGCLLPKSLKGKKSEKESACEIRRQRWIKPNSERPRGRDLHPHPPPSPPLTCSPVPPQFIIEDMKQQQTNKHSKLHREDQHITVEELWRGWKTSEGGRSR